MSGALLQAENLIKQIKHDLNGQERISDSSTCKITEERLAVLRYFLFGKTVADDAQDTTVSNIKEGLIQDLSVNVCIPILRNVYRDEENLGSQMASSNMNLRDKFTRSEESTNGRACQSHLTRVTGICFSLLSDSMNTSDAVVIDLFEICVDSILTFSKHFIEDVLSGRSLHGDFSDFNLGSGPQRIESKLIPIGVASSIVKIIYKLDLDKVSLQCKNSLVKTESNLYEGISSMTTGNPNLLSQLLPLLRSICLGFYEKPISKRLHSGRPAINMDVEAYEETSCRVKVRTGVDMAMELLRNAAAYRDYEQRIFELILSINNSSKGGQDPLPFAVLCGIIDLYIQNTSNCDFDVKCMDEFWLLLQSGLLHEDPLTRKRTVFIFKRAIDSIEEICKSKETHFSVGLNSDPLFWWSQLDAKELKFYWQSFFLLIETLCEKQTHIVVPVLSAFDEVVKAVTTDCLSQGHGYLHLIWLTTLLRKGFQHDSRIIVKWAVQTTLSLDLHSVPLLTECNETFLFENLFQALGHEHLFIKGSNINKGEAPKLLNVLEDFFCRCKLALPEEERKIFFQKTVRSLCQSDLNGIPFFYISKALSSVKVEGFVENMIFEVMRNAIACCISTFPVKIRRGICYCFTKIIFQNLDCSTVTPQGATSYTLLLLGAQHMVYGDSLWNLIISSTAKLNGWFTGNGSNSTNLSPSNLFEVLWHAHVGDNVNDVMNLLCNESTERACVLFLLPFHVLVSMSCDKVHNDQVELDKTMERYVKRLLAPLFDFLVKLKTNPYLSEEKVTKVLGFCSILLQHILARQADTTNANCDYHCKLSERTLSFDRMLLNTMIDAFPVLLDYIEMVLCATLNQFYLKVNRKVHVSFQLQKFIFEVHGIKRIGKLESSTRMHFEKTLKSCSDFLSGIDSMKMDVTLWACMENILFLCQNVNKVVQEQDVRPQLSGILQSIGQVNFMSYSSGKNSSVEREACTPEDIRMSWIISCFWKTVLIFLNNEILFQGTNVTTQEQADVAWQHLNLINCTPTSLVSAVIETYDFVSSGDIHPLLQCMENLLPLICISDRNGCTTALDATWRLFLEQDRRDISYWTLLPCFTSVLFHPCLLLQTEDLLERMKLYWKEMFAIGDEKGGVFNAVTDHISVHWLNVSVDEAKMIYDEFVPIIVDALVFGPIHKKNLMILRDAKNFVSTHIFKKLDDEDNRQDFLVRTKLIDFCLKFANKYSDLQFINQLVEMLIMKDNGLSLKFRRYFGDSLIHRQKLRIWQAVLVFMDLYELRTPEDVNNVLTSLFQALYFDNQPSVRRFVEWAVVLLLRKHTAHLDKLWKKMDTGGESRVGILTSLIGIVHHLSQLYDHGSLQPFIETSISHLLRWTQVQHLQVKLHAQVVLEHLWSLCKSKKWETTLEKYRALEECFSLTDTNSSVVRHRRELARSFFFASFHALNHYSLETIFFKFLKLSGVAEDEWVDCSVFDFNNGKTLKIRDNLDVSIYQDLEEQETKISEVVTNTNKEVQKKISPWSVLPPIDDPLFQEAISRMKNEGQGQLILCASLIDKTPNLGGLCRTCEIFGVNTLVLGSLKYLQDTTFKSLSVTAERWINIEQVIVRKLVGYLEEKKSEGYRIVGVEQTSESTSLEEYRFPAKTVLLLGNEKEGIPVDIIQVVDDCVEIPQQGIIRSLNVHVSGAIMVWEYTRQRLKGHTS